MTSRIQAVLVNDTSVNDHHGCRMVIEQIRVACADAGITVVHAVPIGEDWSAPEHASQIRPERLVIVNGEGTIHHSRPNARRLVACAPYCREVGALPFLINSVFQANDPSLAEAARAFEGVFLRESRSRAELAEQGIQAAVAPDMIFRSAPFIEREAATSDGSILVTDSVHNEISNRLFEYHLQTPGSRFVNLRLPKQASGTNVSRGQVGSHRGLRSRIGRAMARIRSRGMNRAPSPWRTVDLDPRIGAVTGIDRESLLNGIASASLIVTGRFHMVVLAMLARTPFVALDSNTFKTRGMLEDAGLSHRFIERHTLGDGIRADDWWWRDAELASLDHYVDRARQSIDDMFRTIVDRAVDSGRRFAY